MCEPGFVRLDPMGFVAEAGDRDEQRLFAQRILADSLGGAKAVELGHGHVEEHNVVGPNASKLEGFFPVVSDIDLVVHNPKEDSEAVGAIGLVVSHEDAKGASIAV
jgi:hypothetical protein